jgi:hypothetical protein
MKLKDFIAGILKTAPKNKDIKFDIGVDAQMNVDEKSPNRVMFTVTTKNK